MYRRGSWVSFISLRARVSIMTLAFLPYLVLAAEAPRKSPGDEKQKDLEDYIERSKEAAEVLAELSGVPEKGIPKDLLERAHAIAVIPGMVKGAFGIGGSYGKGLLSRRTSAKAWSTPCFVDLGGASLGFQIGVTKMDLVLVFTDDDGLQALLNDKGLKMGVDASVAAGPVGRTASASTNVRMDASIYSYSRSKGLFAGIALDGAGLNINDSANHKVFGKDVSGTDILMRGKIRSNSVVRPFLDALNRYVPARVK
ncbi:MAG: lipid-binding SYLF domain-containing protein [Acidobacteria bacterium]|nr:lipid-binding SYLF domain-containing protein [Acidobacteriota bacterium]